MKLIHRINHSELHPLEGGLSGQTFLVEHGKENCVLRKFPDRKTANFHSDVIKRLQRHRIVPKLLGQHHNLLLLEFISGRTCTKDDATQAAFQVGRICGIINRMKLRNKYDIDVKFFKHLSLIKRRKIITSQEYVKAKKLYLMLKRRLKAKAAMDANDVYPANFRIQNGKIFLVDIEGIKPRLKGRGIAKAFSRWFKKESQRRQFWKGYQKAASSKFWTKDYALLAELYFLVPTISYGADPTRQIKQKDIRALKHLLAKNI